MPKDKELTEPRQRTLELDRAKAAWEAVRTAKGKDAEYQKKYASLAKSAPADIQINGLGQALSFWYAKAKKEKQFTDLIIALSLWLKMQAISPHDDLLGWIIKDADTDAYRRATSEAMAFLVWVKRFATAELAN